MKARLLVIGLLSTFLPLVCTPAATPIWDFPTPQPILSSPAIARDGTIFIGSYDRKIYALTPAGSNKWDYTLPPPIYIYFATYAGVYGTPALGTDGTVYVPSENGKLIGLNPTNGVPKWTNTLTPSDGLYGSPAVGASGTIYVGAYDGDFYAINPNGTRKWFYRAGGAIFASPSVGIDGTIYFGCDDGKLYAVKDNGATAMTRWTFVTGTQAITAAPAIGADGTIYIGVGDAQNPRFYSVSTNGTTNWTFVTGSRIRSSAALGTDGTIYFGCDDQRLYALRPNGTKRWDFPAGGAIGSSPAIAVDGSIVFGCDDGKIYSVASDGSLQWTMETGGSVFASPGIGPDGTIYVASDDGKLYLIRGCQAPAATSWPMYRQNIARTGRVVTSTNQPPVLDAIGDRTLQVGATLRVTNSASDPDGLAQHLEFSLGPGAPQGATIHPTSGLLTWTPGPGQGDRTNVISVAVMDDGIPNLSAAQCFTVVVTGRPRILSIHSEEGTVELQWSALAGRSYRVQYKSQLEEGSWHDLPGSILADGPVASKSDSPPAGAEQRFYQVELLP
jgi:outer membrane protein assembly factor BamB